ncbi:MAG: DNA polymerase III subunit gamma/tau [candidate division WS1 bacterium]|jgi:DNA polymerase-3 subunit gamma/tau|nr:DNA polymerase III subunit gamma/tau [candidate division WS1 bacterium]
MAYQTFALKYRPQTFDEIIGQDHVATTLKNALAEGRVAHGYLFAGPRGTGKTTTARVLAKALSCEAGPTAEPCGECSMCLAISAGNAMDLIEIDAASHRGIDDIRELRQRVGYAPTQARCKFYILDEAHQLTPEASNALLKTLEEPPDHAYFVFATTEPHKILPTIRSRCQTFEFRPIPQAYIVEALRAIAQSEGVKVEEQALGTIARAAGGAMRDAESIFDQVIAYARGDVTLEIVNSVLGVTDAELLGNIADAVAGGNTEGVFGCVDEVVASGKDIGQLIEDLSLYFRDLLRMSLGANPPAWMQATSGGREGMQAQAAALGPRRLGEIIEELGDAAVHIRDSAQKPLLLEVTLAHLTSIPDVAPAAPATQAPQQTAEPPVEETAEPAVEEAPPPAEAAPPASEPAASEVTLDTVKSLWSQMVQTLISGGHPAVAAIVGRAEPSALEGARLELVFPASAQFEYERASKAYTTQIAGAISGLCGSVLEVSCRLQEAAPQPQAPEHSVPEGETVAETAAEDGAGDESDAERQARMVEAIKRAFDGSDEVEKSPPTQ